MTEGNQTGGASDPKQLANAESAGPPPELAIQKELTPSFATAPAFVDEAAPLVLLPPRAPHPGFGWALLWCLGIVIVTQLLPGFVGGFLLVVVSASRNPGRVQDPHVLLRSPQFAQVMMWSFLFGQLLSLVLAWLAIRLIVKKEWPRVLALRWPSGSHVVLALLGLPGLMFISVGVDGLAKQVLPSLVDFDQTVRMFGQWPWAMGVLVIGLGPGISEELWFRGFLGRGLVSRNGVVGGVLLTSLLFGLVHLEPRQAAYSMVIGIMLHLTYLASRSLLIPMLLHIANNTLSIVALHSPLFQVIDMPAEELPWYVFAAAVLLVAAVGWAFYRSRATLVDAPEATAAPWRPAFDGVEYPPSGTATEVVYQTPNAWCWSLVGAGLVLFAAVLVPTAAKVDAGAARHQDSRRSATASRTDNRYQSWQHFALPDADCTVLMPDLPAAVQPPRNLLGYPLTFHAARTDDPELEFAIGCIPRTGVTPTRHLLAECKKQLLAWMPEAHLIRETDVDLMGYPGQELVLHDGRSGAVVIFRTYAVSGHFYLMRATGNKVVPEHADLQMFLSSIELTGNTAALARQQRRTALDDLEVPWVRFLAWSPDSKTLITSAQSRAATLWDIAPGQWSKPRQNSRPLHGAMAFAPNGRWVAASSGADDRGNLPGGGLVCGWPELEPALFLETRGLILALAVSPDSKTLAVAFDGHVNLWSLPEPRAGNLAKGREWLRETDRVNYRSIDCVQFTADGRKLITSRPASRGNLRLTQMWDVSTAKPLLSFGCSQTPALGLPAFSPRSKYLAQPGPEGCLIWDLDADQELFRARGLPPNTAVAPHRMA
jgi:membrane protease YdiL (CAAX protease family)